MQVSKSKFLKNYRGEVQAFLPIDVDISKKVSFYYAVIIQFAPETD